MNEETTVVMVLVASLGTIVFMSVRWKLRQTRRQQSLGDMYRPAPKNQTRPGATE